MGSFLLGLGAGMVGGLLMAPKPGSYYRDYLKDKTAGLRDSASGAVEKGKAAVSQQLENLAIKTNHDAVYQR
jgi:gas vesicle protein